MKQPRRKETKAQAAAARHNLVAAREAQTAKRAYERKHHLPLQTKRQRQASLRNLERARIAQQRKRQGLKPLPKATRGFRQASGLLPAFGNDLADVCSAAAVAGHLWLATGHVVSDAEVAQVAEVAGGVIEDVLEYVSCCGLSGYRLEDYWPLESGLILAGSVAGLQLPQGGRHAATLLSNGRLLSWGSILPVDGVVEETWWLEWAPDGLVASAAAH